MRLLAEMPNQNLYRPFPDLETAELLALHLPTRNVIGLQLKTVEVEEAKPTGSVHVLASSFRPSPTTLFAVFAWRRDEKRFHESCLLIPSQEIEKIAQPKKTSGHLKFDWNPTSNSPSRLDPFRIDLSDLGTRLEALLT